MNIYCCRDSLPHRSISEVYKLTTISTVVESYRNHQSIKWVYKLTTISTVVEDNYMYLCSKVYKLTTISTVVEHKDFCNAPLCL